MDIPDPSKAYKPIKEAIILGEAVIECLDRGMTSQEVQEVVDSAIEANVPASHRFE